MEPRNCCMCKKPGNYTRNCPKHTQLVRGRVFEMTHKYVKPELLGKSNFEDKIVSGSEVCNVQQFTRPFTRKKY